jgi:hypothetical protein
MRFICVPSFGGKSAWAEVSQYALYCHYAGLSSYDKVTDFVVNSQPGSVLEVGPNLLIRVKNEPEQPSEQPA